MLQRELEVAATIQDLYSGRPVIYSMFLGYDEVAHHSGIERPETLKELAKIDRAFGAARTRRSGRVAALPHRRARRPRPVAGSHVKQRNADRSLADLVSTLIGSDEVLAPGGVDEGWGYLNAAATEVTKAGGAVGTVAAASPGRRRPTTEPSTSDPLATSRDASGDGRRRKAKRAYPRSP